MERKTETYLNNLTYKRLSNYYKSLQAQLGRSSPPVCECCGEVLKGDELSDDKQKEFEENHKYVMFVKAIIKRL